VNLSRRIRNENERNRLRALAILVKPAGMGIVIRTEAEGMPEEAIMEDLETLQKQWEAILQEATSTRAPALLNRDDDFIQRVLRDVYSNDVNRIVVDSHTGLKRVKQQLLNWGGGKTPQGVLIDHHRDRIPILEYFRVSAAIREALKPRVDLPSGGYIIIERTEALTVIDVNSGSFTRSATARETVLWTNCEAATEIARQLRLRNIAGVIIVDFIDMDSRRDQLQVLEHFNKALRSDKARPQISQLSELGLVELTRKRQGKNLYELFGKTCPTCGGLGLLAHLPGETYDNNEDGESLERTVAFRENRRSEPRRELAPAPSEPFWDGGEEAADEGGESDLELLHHPSYQERNRSNRRRRRRNGDDFGQPQPQPRPAGTPPRPVPWEDSPSRYGSTATIAPITARTEYSGEPEEAAPAEETFTSRERQEHQERQERGENRFEDRRGRNRRGSMRPMAEPPESVYVEMTPEEQDVYAWMGISPLVLSEQEVKNPKSAIVSVFLPGEAPEMEVVETSVAAEEEEEEEDFATQVEMDLPAVAEMPAIAPLPEPEIGESVELEEDDDTPVTRRRRRRSSASAD
jgi:ribonuclease E